MTKYAIIVEGNIIRVIHAVDEDRAIDECLERGIIEIKEVDEDE